MRPDPRHSHRSRFRSRLGRRSWSLQGRRRLAVGLSLTGLALLLAPLDLPSGFGLQPLTEPGLSLSILSDGNASDGLVVEGQRPDPASFTPEELRALRHRFGVRGPQPRLAQLFTSGLDQLTPLRARTVHRLEELRPLILRESRRHQLNPMLVAAVLFDEMQHAKPGEDVPIAASSGLFSTHGPAQIGIQELVHQGLLAPDASPEEIAAARLSLLEPDTSVKVLVGKFVRISRELGLPRGATQQVSSHPRAAKAVATLAYLHNGKLDYPVRILRYMQDAELHGLIYGQRQEPISGLI